MANGYVRSLAIPPYPMACPDSASFRCLNALRYFVRSYVTRPTTMRAITETPANTPRPMGRTDSLFPGSVNAAAWEEALAAAAEAVEAVDDAEAAAAVAPGVEEELGREDADAAGTVDAPLTFTAGLMEADADGVAAGTVDTPLTFTAGLTEGDADRVAAGTVDTPLTDTAGFAEDGADGVAAGTVDTPLTLTAGFPEDDEADGVAAGTVETPLTFTAGFAVEPVDVLLLVLLVEEVVWDELDEDEATAGDADVVVPPLLPPVPVLSNVKVHCFTSCTSGLPLIIMGVSVT